MNEQNSIAFKIRKYRKIKNLSIDQLSQLCDIHASTLKKYENGSRNPKPDQLLKISSALGVSINAFIEFDLNTVSDVLSLLMRMDEQTDMTWSAQRDSDGKIIPSTISFSFNDEKLNNAISNYMEYKEETLPEHVDMTLENHKFQNDSTKSRLLLFNDSLKKRNDT